MISENHLFVKICGLRTEDDVDAAINAGADAIGVVMAEGSPRHVGVETAQTLISGVAGRAVTVLVVKGITPAQAVDFALKTGVDVLQLHGFDARQTAKVRQGFSRVWRAESLGSTKGTPDLHVGAHGEELLLLDSPSAGSGERWDISALKENRPHGPWLLAGGLDPENVARAIVEATPHGVDVSSGVESSPGVKDHARIARFIANARSALTQSTQTEN